MSDQRFYPPNSEILQIKQKRLPWRVHNGNVQLHNKYHVEQCLAHNLPRRYILKMTKFSYKIGCSVRLQIPLIKLTLLHILKI